jgi:uncharacterized protein (DUF3084 family)
VLKVELQNLQATSQTLVKQLETSKAKSTALQAESTNLNKALAAERATTQELRAYFNMYEAEKSAQISSLSSEVVRQREKVLEAEKAASFWRMLAIAAVGAIIVFMVFKIVQLLRKLKIIPV